MNQHNRRVVKKRSHGGAPILVSGYIPFAARNSLIAAAISTTCVSVAKCPVSRNWTCAWGRSLRKASAPAGIKNESFRPQIASKGGFELGKYSWTWGESIALHAYCRN